MRGQSLVVSMVLLGALGACRREPAPELAPPAPPPAVKAPAAVPVEAPALPAEVESEKPIGPKPRTQTKAAAARRKPKAAVVGVLNLNRATEAELRLLPGVGKGRAHAIVERRKGR